MKLVCISDTHGLHRKLFIPDGDVLIHAGDFMTTGMLEKEIIDFEDWLISLPHEHKIFIAGNHDRWMQMKISKDILSGKNIYLEDSKHIIQGVRFYGSPWTPTFLSWAFMQDRGPQIKRYWDNIPNDTDVLITHGPPKGILDHVPSVGYQGCNDLMNKVCEINPKAHIFGHIHCAAGQEEITIDRNGRTIKFVNAAVTSIVNNTYILQNPPIVIDI